MSWLVSSGKLPESVKNIRAGSFHVYTSEEEFLRKFDEDTFIGIDGYVLPRHPYFNEYSSINQYELIYRLYKNKGKDFIGAVKGFFTVIIIDKEELLVYNDRHALKKFFYRQVENNFLVSGALSSMKNAGSGSFSLDKTAVALFCVMEHFIAGKSLFAGISYSKAASVLHFKDGQLQENTYWNYLELLDLPKEKEGIDEMAYDFAAITGEYVQYLKPEGISVTLTGGNDSRFVLAALLNNEIKPAAFTFGSSRSRDVGIAKQISKRAELDYHNYDFENMSAALFRQRAEEIIENGNTLINIHRAHRLDAVIRERENHAENNMILGGFMGGEYTKGVTFDGYIIPSFLENIHQKNKSELKDELAGILSKRFLRFDDELLENLIIVLEEEGFLQKMDKQQQALTYAYKLYAVAHHTQDPAVFASRFRYSVNPFMDIDFMEMLFKSRYSLKDEYLDPSFKSRLFVLGTHYLSPELSDIQYGKKGAYTAREMKAGILPYYLKRIPRYFKRKKYPPNFPYGDWMKEYCRKELEQLKPSDLFTIEKAEESIEQNRHHFTEGYWHNYTNMINLLKNHNHYAG